MGKREQERSVGRCRKVVLWAVGCRWWEGSRWESGGNIPVQEEVMGLRVASVLLAAGPRGEWRCGIFFKIYVQFCRTFEYLCVCVIFLFSSLYLQVQILCIHYILLYICRMLSGIECMGASRFPAFIKSWVQYLWACTTLLCIWQPSLLRPIRKYRENSW